MPHQGLDSPQAVEEEEEEDVEVEVAEPEGVVFV